MQQNTALIDDIMAALDAESSQNVELIVRNTQNGATKKMALASLEQIIYSYLTTAPVVTSLASVLGATVNTGSADANTVAAGLHFCGANVSNTPELYGMLLTFQYSSSMKAQFFLPTNNCIYYRYYAANQWDVWNKLQP